MTVARSATGPLVALALGYAAGCASQPLPQAAQQKPASVEPIGPAFVSPARWDFHPPAPAAALTTVMLGDEGCLFTAEGGQRWWSAGAKSAAKEDDSDAGAGAPPQAKGPAKKGGPGCPGIVEASSFVAPEELVGAMRRNDRSWVFVGETGVLYEAKEPLGAFTRAVPAPEPFARVSGAGSVMLGATWEGRMLRWEAATGWRPLPKPPGAGSAAIAPNAPPPARVFDVVVGDGGRALALAFPEALFTSDDGGASWSPAGAQPFGARVLGRTAEGDLAAQGVFETVTWRPGKSPALARSKAAIPGGSGGIEPDVGRAPQATAIFDGRAVLDGDRYYEVIGPDAKGDPWRLARGRIEGRLEVITISNSGACSNVRIGAHRLSLVAVCVVPEKGELSAKVRRSTDAGSTWSEPLELATPDTRHLDVAVAEGGSALITGVCARSEPRKECKPNAPMLVRARAGGLDAIITGAPQVTGLALLPAFSPDGKSAYFLGRRGKDDKINLFVSHDGGETFAPRTVDPAAAGLKPPPRPRHADDEEEEAPSQPEIPDVLQVDDSSTLRPGEDGSIGLHLKGGNDHVYVTADEDGRVVGAVTPPSDDAVMGGFGRRVVAVALNQETGATTTWESLDGGASWDQQRAPPSLAREYGRAGTPRIACSIAGCLVGDTLSRVGWGAGGEQPSIDLPSEPAPAQTLAVLTPIVCELSAKTKWARIDDVFAAQSYGNPLPDFGSVMRRRSVWSVLTLDPVTGQITAVSADLPESGDGDARVTSRTLLAAHPPTQHLATSISRQAEGWSVARVPFAIERGQVKPGSSMKGVEVVWENYMTSATGRGRIADAGPFERYDVSVGAFDTLDTGMLSVTTSGIVVRPHSRRAIGNRMAFFLDMAGRAERFDLPDWPTRGLGGLLDLRGDTAATDGHLFGVGLVHARDGTTNSIVLARPTTPLGKPGTTWEYNALALTPARDGAPLAFSTDWAYLGKNMLGMTVLVADPRRQRAWAHFQGFRGDVTFAPPVPLATPYDLGERPRPCTTAERMTTPRFEAGFFSGGAMIFPGMRHPVLVSEPPAKNAVGVVEPIALLTGGAVIHGTPSSPCIAGWDARAVGRGPLSAVVQGDLKRAWIFRITTDPGRAARRGDNGAQAIEYRPMTCKYDPGARVPDAVWNEPGTQRN